MSNSSTEIINEEPNINEASQSQEDKFFGVKTEINTNPSDEVEIEVVDDTPKEDRRPKKSKEADSKVDMILLIKKYQIIVKELLIV